MKWRQPTTSWAAWWQAIAFPVLRDIACLGTGLYAIISQVGKADPSSLVLTVGLILVAPVAAIHGMAVLTGPSSTQHGGPSSSGPAPPPSSLPPSPSSPGGGSREGHG